jgi:tetratricopeptide (TPR) repeat protein
MNETNTYKKVSHLISISKLYKSVNKIKSLEYAKKAMENSKSIKDDKLKIKAMNRLAVAYFETDDLANAFLYYKKSLVLLKELHDLMGEANTIYNIALLYHASDDPVNSQKYLKQALRLISENMSKDQDLTSGIYEAMATNWYKLNKLDSAEKYYQAAFKVIVRHKTNYHLINHYYNTAEFFYKKGDYENCASELDLMHKAMVKNTDFGMKAYHLYLTAKLNLISGHLTLAEKNALSTMRLAKQNGYKEAVGLASGVLSEVKERINQLDSALYYGKLSQLYQDSLKGSSIKNLLQFADTEIEEYESTLLDLKLKNQQKTLILLISSVVSLTILLGVTFYFLKREKILKSNIESKSKKINQQNLKLLTQTNEMSSLMSTLEEILKEKNSQLNNYAFYNAHRLRAPIARILGLEKVRQISPTSEEKLYISNKICEVTEELEAMTQEGQKLLGKLNNLSDL